MKKKILLGIMGMFLLSGCSVNYEITIDKNNNFQENVTIDANVSENYDKSYLYASFLEEYPTFIDQEFPYYNPTEKLDGNTYYEKSYRETANGYLFNYKTNYNLSNIEKARSINVSFTNFGIKYIESLDYYYISLKNPKIFQTYNNLDMVTVKISLNDLVVLKNNADIIQENTYIWIMKPDNLKNIEISYKVKKDRVETSDPIREEPKKEETNWANKHKVLIMVGSFILLIGIVFGISFLKKGRL